MGGLKVVEHGLNVFNLALIIDCFCVNPGHYRKEQRYSCDHFYSEVVCCAVIRDHKHIG